MSDLTDGESIEVQGSAKKPYVIQNVGGVYSCSCPAWRNQSLGIESRTCKHIRKLRGDEAEKERVGDALPTRRASKAKQDGPPLLLAHRWENEGDLGGWWMSEKLDGVRAYWDGTKFLSRQGNEFFAPDWFVEGLPETPLDGELWMDRKSFQKTVSIVRRQDKSDHWKNLKFLVFDAPAMSDAFETRVKSVEDTVARIGSEFVQALDHQLCRSVDHLREELDRVESLGGEGLMLREPGSKYEVGRSTSLLKVKTFHDADAVVIDHAAGKGRHKGRVGSLVVRMSDGTEFSVGTGLTDRQRESPPEPGTTITYRFQELTDAGVPRFPSFVRVRTDVAAARPPATKVSDTPRRSRIKATPVSDANEQTERSYFELIDGKSAKFWEVSLDDCTVTVRYGRTGTNGQTRTKEFPDASAAQVHVEKLIHEKTGKGYEAKATR